MLVTGKGRAQITAKADGGKVVALADPGAMARLKACTPDACHIRGEEHRRLDRQSAHLGRRRGRGVRQNFRVSRSSSR